MSNKLEIQMTAEALVANGKGILAADESLGSIQKRFEPYSIVSTPESRRSYRELLITTPEIEEFISGVILFDETIKQSTGAGRLFPQYLAERGIFTGIKVDKGLRPMPAFAGEKITEGLDGLRERLEEYRNFGAKFAKWRAVFEISPGTPSRYAIRANALLLAQYAILCQEEGLTPIIEPEVLNDGPHHICMAEEVTDAVLTEVFAALKEAHVILEGMLLKPNMVMAGGDFPKPSEPEEVAESTLRVLRRCVPAAVPGIVFLSGGQSANRATMNLQAMNAMGKAPWQLSFSFGRALQSPTLEQWRGQQKNIYAAQSLFTARAHYNHLAVLGQYDPTQDQTA